MKTWIPRASLDLKSERALAVTEPVTPEVRAPRRLALAALAVVSAEIALWWVTGVWRISRGFLQAAFGSYVALFFPLLTLATFVYVRRGASSLLRSAVTGFLSGYALSVVAVTLAGLLLPDGLLRFENAVRLSGPVGFVLTQLLGAALLGGWLFGALAFAIAARLR